MNRFNCRNKMEKNAGIDHKHCMLCNVGMLETASIGRKGEGGLKDQQIEP